MGRWDDEHPAITVRFAPKEREAVLEALGARGTSAHDVLWTWAQGARDEAELARVREELRRLKDELATLERRRSALRREVANRRRASERKLRRDLAELSAERDRLTALVGELGTQVEENAMLLARAGVAPDDPALGVLLAVVMLRPVAEGADRGAVAEALAFLRAAADELRRGRPEPTAVTLAESLMRSVRATERRARAEVRGRLWGAAVSLAARRRAEAEGAGRERARLNLERGMAPPEWTRLAEEAARDAGLHVTEDTVAMFLRGAADAVRSTLADMAEDPTKRALGQRR